MVMGLSVDGVSEDVAAGLEIDEGGSIGQGTGLLSL